MLSRNPQTFQFVVTSGPLQTAVVCPMTDCWPFNLLAAALVLSALDALGHISYRERDKNPLWTSPSLSLAAMLDLLLNSLILLGERGNT